jgi:hypothetical protein
MSADIGLGLNTTKWVSGIKKAMEETERLMGSVTALDKKIEKLQESSGGQIKNTEQYAQKIRALDALMGLYNRKLEAYNQRSKEMNTELQKGNKVSQQFIESMTDQYKGTQKLKAEIEAIEKELKQYTDAVKEAQKAEKEKNKAAYENRQALQEQKKEHSQLNAKLRESIAIGREIIKEEQRGNDADKQRIKSLKDKQRIVISSAKTEKEWRESVEKTTVETKQATTAEAAREKGLRGLWNRLKQSHTAETKMARERKKTIKTLKEQAAATDKTKNALREYGEFANSKFIKFGMTMSGVAATLFVFQQAIQWVANLANYFMTAEKTVMELRDSLSLNKKEADAFKESMDSLAETGFRSHEQILEEVTKYVEEGRTVTEALIKIQDEINREEALAAGTYTGELASLKGELQELGSNLARVLEGPIFLVINAAKGALSLINSILSTTGAEGQARFNEQARANMAAWDAAQARKREKQEAARAAWGSGASDAMPSTDWTQLYKNYNQILQGNTPGNLDGALNYNPFTTSAAPKGAVDVMDASTFRIATAKGDTSLLHRIKQDRDATAAALKKDAQVGALLDSVDKASGKSSQRQIDEMRKNLSIFMARYPDKGQHAEGVVAKEISDILDKQNREAATQSGKIGNDFKKELQDLVKKLQSDPDITAESASVSIGGMTGEGVKALEAHLKKESELLSASADARKDLEAKVQADIYALKEAGSTAETVLINKITDENQRAAEKTAKEQERLAEEEKQRLIRVAAEKTRVQEQNAAKAKQIEISLMNETKGYNSQYREWYIKQLDLKLKDLKEHGAQAIDLENLRAAAITKLDKGISETVLKMPRIDWRPA